MNKTKLVLFTAIFSLITIFTLSCGEVGGDESQNQETSSSSSYKEVQNGNSSSSAEATPSSSSAVGNNSSSSAIQSSSSIAVVDCVEPIPENHFCDNRNGKIYRYTTIGVQTWMAENLNYNANGSKCGYKTNVGASNGELKDEDTAYCDEYGRLYNWTTAMNGADSSGTVPSGVQGICPDGWHLPSSKEWDVLINFADPDTHISNEGFFVSVAGTKLKAMDGGWYFLDNGWKKEGNGTDDYGFSALPGGIGSSASLHGAGTTNFNNVGVIGKWWTSEYVKIANSEGPYFRLMSAKISDVDKDYESRFNSVYYSVRCVKN
jgi:uncharacterized protein (TIGR02145 family)